MEVTKRCIPCNGSGKLMGGGMITADCDNCNGVGKVKEVAIDEMDYLAMKQTEGYRSAKKRLQSSHPDLSGDEAEKLLDEAFENEKPKATRKRKAKDADQVASA